MNLLFLLGYSIAWSFFWLSGGLRVIGREYVPRDGGFLVCANHQSQLDPPAIGVALKADIGYVAKKELFANPVFGFIIRRLGAIAIDRTRLRRETIDGLRRTLAQGKPVLMFPEGTRSRDGEIADPKIGTGLLAHAAGAAILPACVQNTRLWPRTWKRDRRIVIRFGEPITPEWLTSIPRNREGFRQIATEIIRRIRVLQSKTPAPSSPAKGDDGPVEKANTCPKG